MLKRFHVRPFFSYNKRMSLNKIFDTSWHSISAREASHILETDQKRGLTKEQVQQRKVFFGANALPEKKPAAAIITFLKQFRSPLIFILVIAGSVTLFFQEYTDSVVIFGTVLINTVIGYVQERKAANALGALRKVLKQSGVVVREENTREIPREDIVPGDIIILSAGDKVPADARIIESRNLQINEAALTGEWISSSKKPSVLDRKMPLADRDNMAYMGTIVEGGKGKALVVATGIQTELGKVGALLEKISDEPTPYQKRLSRFAWKIGMIVTIVVLLIFLQGIATGGEFIEMFEIAVAVAVSAIPEGLAIAMTIVLAIGMQRILRKKGLVRRLASAETLGNTSVIATDKTLTLTEGKMQVEEIVPLRITDREQALIASTLANEAYVENPDAVFENWIVRGRPTDRALIKASADAGISKVELEKNLPLVLRIPFDSESKYIASFHQTETGVKLYVSGAPEKILSLSYMSEDEKKQAQEKLEELTQRGLRVVSVATRDIVDKLPKLDKEKEEYLRNSIHALRFIGFIALKDPLRKGVKEAIQSAKEAGLKTIIVTGDHLLTAKAVAQELGLPSHAQNIIDGESLSKLSDEELKIRLPHLSVFARVEPVHKLRIIEAWQSLGAVIAMTGDGVNDAPALKKADIGIAPESGTDVAKEASDLILLTDDFSIIPAAIREGRVILDNIRKIITYLLSDSFTETILIGASLLVGAPFLPITALQILWINLIESTLPSIALTLEKPESDVMKRKPQPQNAGLLTGEMKMIIFAIGIITDLLLLALFFWLLRTSDYSQLHIQTILFVGLGLNSLLYVFSCRSLRRNIWEFNPFSNVYLVGSVVIGLVLLVGVVYAPIFLQDIISFDVNFLNTEALNLFDWILLGALAIINISLIEAVKLYFIRRERRKIMA